MAGKKQGLLVVDLGAETKHFIGTKELARLCGRDQQTLLRWVRDGKLPQPEGRTQGQHYRWRTEDLRAWLASQDAAVVGLAAPDQPKPQPRPAPLPGTPMPSLQLPPVALGQVAQALQVRHRLRGKSADDLRRLRGFLGCEVQHIETEMGRMSPAQVWAITQERRMQSATLELAMVEMCLEELPVDGGEDCIGTQGTEPACRARAELAVHVGSA